MKTHILLSSFFLLISLSFFSQSATSGLVAYYPFNGNANDKSTTANHASAHGAALTTDRLNNPDQAYLFNGSTDRLQAPENDAYDFGDGDFSITSWVSLNEIKTARIVSAGYKSDEGIWGLGVGSHPVWGTGLRINYFVYSGGAYHDFSSDEITGYTLGRWAMVGITKTGNTLTFYFNGKKAGTAAISLISNSNSYLSIGSRQEASGSHIEFLNGKIDEVRIYKRGLSEAEIGEQYNLTHNSLVAYYPFNGNANDESGNGYNGTINGNATLTPDRFKDDKKAFTFPDQSSNISLANTTDMNLQNGFTMHAWVKYKNKYSVIACKHVCGFVNGFIFGIDYDGQIQLALANSGWSTVKSNTTFVENRWYLVTATYNAGSGTAKIYINGELSGSGNISYTNFSSHPISIGEAFQNNCQPANMNGAIDEVKIYDQPLSDAEILQEYTSTKSSLVAYYPFNGNANDESGNGYNGVISGATITQDRFNQPDKSYNFVYNGFSSDKIQVSGTSDLNFSSGGFSIGAWVKFSGLATEGYNYPIFSKHICGEQSGYILMLYNGKLTFWLAGSGGYNVLGTSDDYTDNSWHHVVAVYDGSTQYIYVDGELKNSMPFSYSSFNSANWALGGYNGCNGGFNGKVDEIQVFNNALTGIEIQNIYNSSRNSLVAYYPFNGNANDQSGNGNNGTLMNGPSYIPDRSDNADKAIRFDKSASQYVSVPSSPSLQIDKAISFSFWLKRNSLGGQDQVLNKGGDWPNGNCNYGLVFSDWTLCFIYDGGYYIVASPGVPQDNDWHHYAVTAIEGTTEVRFYVDGIEKTAMFGGGNPVINFYSQSTADLHISGINYFSNNSIDELKIYNRILTANEIKFDYSNLVAYYPFNGNANDESGNGNNGTITGPMVTPAVDRYGAEGKAYKFWYPDYVSVPTNSSFFTDEFTVSYWYKVESYWGARCVLSCVGNNGGYQQPFDGTGFTYLLGYNFSNPGEKWFWTSYNVPNTPGTWQHITTSYKKTGDNASISKLYINGELKSSDTYTNSIAYPGSEIFYLGRNHSDVGLNGELDDVRFYNRMLTDAEVLALFTAESPTAVINPFSSNIRISPNPTDGHFGIDLGTNYQKIELRIMDMTGRVIKKLRYSDQQKITVNLESPSGIYFLNIVTESENGTYKLIKKQRR